MKEETELDSILDQAANIRLHTWSPSQWTLNFVPDVYRNGHVYLPYLHARWARSVFQWCEYVDALLVSSVGSD